jgi:hypothetical protein
MPQVHTAYSISERCRVAGNVQGTCIIVAHAQIVKCPLAASVAGAYEVTTRGVVAVEGPGTDWQVPVSSVLEASISAEHMVQPGTA